MEGDEKLTLSEIRENFVRACKKLRIAEATKWNNIIQKKFEGTWHCNQVTFFHRYCTEFEKVLIEKAYICQSFVT